MYFDSREISTLLRNILTAKTLSVARQTVQKFVSQNGLELAEEFESEIDNSESIDDLRDLLGL